MIFQFLQIRKNNWIHIVVPPRSTHVWLQDEDDNGDFYPLGEVEANNAVKRQIMVGNKW
jgi:hypothetical protein